MSKEKIFGSDTDMALRILMLLAVCGKKLNVDRMVSFDFIATYGYYFGIDDRNLHGDNEYGFGELSVRRKVICQSIRYLVMQALIEVVDSEDGFSYAITERGRSVVDGLSVEYAVNYKRTAATALRKWGEDDDHGLRRLIDLRSKEIQKKRGELGIW